ncbi:hypothetical protein [Uliginosibacterium sp. H1]|uniref:hypothetical protein n=1 Tax=Uliginosibacterium sp. H1 TaxID=3114757 RepID=UPI002E18B991|nr:hypothetical protein [Uliginosibacterium sp. H1]
MKPVNDASFERFLQGEDGLSALLRELPAFEPPTRMEEDFAQAARVAQASHDAPSAALTDDILSFEPPAGMQADFARMAAKLQAEQAPRREAVIAQLARGDDAAAVLGGDISARTREWLDRQQAAKSERPVVVVARKPRFRWLPGLGLAASAALVAGVATQWLMRGEAPADNVALNEVPAAAPAQLAIESEKPVAPAAEPTVRNRSAGAPVASAQDRQASAEREASRTRAQDEEKRVASQPDAVADATKAREEIAAASAFAERRLAAPAAAPAPVPPQALPPPAVIVEVPAAEPMPESLAAAPPPPAAPAPAAKAAPMRERAASDAAMASAPQSPAVQRATAAALAPVRSDLPVESVPLASSPEQWLQALVRRTPLPPASLRLHVQSTTQEDAMKFAEGLREALRRRDIATRVELTADEGIPADTVRIDAAGFLP